MAPAIIHGWMHCFYYSFTISKVFGYRNVSLCKGHLSLYLKQWCSDLAFTSCTQGQLIQNQYFNNIVHIRLYRINSNTIPPSYPNPQGKWLPSWVWEDWELVKKVLSTKCRAKINSRNFWMKFLLPTYTFKCFFPKYRAILTQKAALWLTSFAYRAIFKY